MTPFGHKKNLKIKISHGKIWGTDLEKSSKCWFWTQKCLICPILGIIRTFKKVWKKSLPSFIEPYLPAKTREKVTSHSWEKDITDGLTDGRTDGQKRTHGQILWSNKRKSKWCTHFNYFSFYPYQSIKVDISEGIKFTNGPAVSEIKHTAKFINTT